MPWTIRLLAAPPVNDRKIGDAWFAEPQWLEGAKAQCCPYYHANNAHRPPLFVVLPSRSLAEHGYPESGFPFLVDGFTYPNGERGKAGWVVTGEPPKITVSPSIDVKGAWHGHINNGVISDDLESARR